MGIGPPGAQMPAFRGCVFYFRFKEHHQKPDGWIIWEFEERLFGKDSEEGRLGWKVGSGCDEDWGLKGK